MNRPMMQVVDPQTGEANPADIQRAFDAQLPTALAWRSSTAAERVARLKALREAYPQAQLHGLEWSWPLRALCALRCPWARVRQGDIWRADWGVYDLVYLFQRPESMARALAKAHLELKPGRWLVSLEVEATQWRPQATLQCPDGRTVWLYCAPFQAVMCSKDASPPAVA